MPKLLLGRGAKGSGRYKGKLSDNKYKRVQGFPDDYVIRGCMSAQYKPIGNAVPIAMGRAIAKALRAHMEGKLESADGIFTRYKVEPRQIPRQ